MQKALVIPVNVCVPLARNHCLLSAKGSRGNPRHMKNVLLQLQ